MVRRIPPSLLVQQPAPNPSTPTASRTESLSVGDTLKIPSIPGFKTSAAFLTSLSANLRLDDDFFPSPMSTPPSMRGSTETIALPPPSPLSNSMSLTRQPSSGGASDPQTADAPTADATTLPELRTYAATARDDKVAALKLVADSIAEQRSISSKTLMVHPLNASIFVLLLSVVARYQYKSSSDIPLIVTTCAGLTMAAMVLVRWCTSGYILLAEELGWDWLGDRDEVLVTKWGEDVIGVCVVGLLGGEGKGNRKKRSRGEIKAWTVKRRYRHKGVGTALLEEAVQVVQSKGGDGIEFAEDHANATRLLKPMYNGAVDKSEARAQRTLERIVTEKGAFGTSKRR